MSSPFELHRGSLQQRMPSGAIAGAYLFELGHFGGGDARLRVGDYHEVSQTFLRAAQSFFIRPQVQIVPAAEPPLGSLWRFTVRLNGTVVYARTLPTDKPRFDVTDIAIPLVLANAPPTTNTLAFRLEIV